MSDTSQGDDWWEASDSKWYRPEDHPDYVDPRPPPPTPPPPRPKPSPSPDKWTEAEVRAAGCGNDAVAIVAKLQVLSPLAVAQLADDIGSVFAVWEAIDELMAIGATAGVGQRGALTYQVRLLPMDRVDDRGAAPEREAGTVQTEYFGFLSITAAFAAVASFAPWADNGRRTVSGFEAGPGVLTLMVFGAAFVLAVLADNDAISRRGAGIGALVCTGIGSVYLGFIWADFANAAEFYNLTGVEVAWGLILGIVAGAVGAVLSLLAIAQTSS